jgi:hypothetical protein
VLEGVLPSSIGKNIPFCAGSNDRQWLFFGEVQVEEDKVEAAGNDLVEHAHTFEAVAASDSDPDEKAEEWSCWEVLLEARPD